MTRLISAMLAGASLLILASGLSGCQQAQSEARPTTTSADAQMQRSRAVAYYNQATTFKSKSNYKMANDFYHQAIDAAKSDPGARLVWYLARSGFLETIIIMQPSSPTKADIIQGKLGELDQLLAEINASTHPDAHSTIKRSISVSKMLGGIKLKNSDLIRQGVAMMDQIATETDPVKNKIEYVTNALNRCDAFEGIARIQKTITSWEEYHSCAKSLTSLQDDAHERHKILINRQLGVSLRDFGLARSDTAMIEKGLVSLQKAADGIKPDMQPDDWAMIQSDLGFTYQHLGTLRKSPESLRKASEAFSRASATYKVIGNENLASTLAAASMAAEIQLRKLNPGPAKPAAEHKI